MIGRIVVSMNTHAILIVIRLSILSCLLQGFFLHFYSQFNVSQCSSCLTFRLIICLFLLKCSCISASFPSPYFNHLTSCCMKCGIFAKYHLTHVEFIVSHSASLFSLISAILFINNRKPYLWVACDLDILILFC